MLKRKIIAFLCIMLFGTSLLLLNSILIPSTAQTLETEWWDEDWFCRKLLTLNSGVTEDPDIQGGASYQYSFIVVKENGYDGASHTMYGNSYVLVDCEGNSQDNFGDLRFLDRSNNVLPYCIEEVWNEDINFALITVKVPTSTYVNETTGYLWMYYNYNGTASTTSSPTSTYFVYEDFEDGILTDDYAWTTWGDTIFTVSTEWSYSIITDSYHAMTPHLANSSKITYLWLSLASYVSPWSGSVEGPPLNISFWAAGKIDPPSGSYFTGYVVGSSGLHINGTLEDEVMWEPYDLSIPSTMIDGSSAQLHFDFFHDSSSTYDWEAAAIDNIVVRNGYTPSPYIESVGEPNTYVISYTLFPEDEAKNVSVTNNGSFTSINVTNIAGNSMDLAFYVYNFTNGTLDVYETYSGISDGEYGAYIPPEYCYRVSVVYWQVLIYDTEFNVVIYTNLSSFELAYPFVSDVSPTSGTENISYLPVVLEVNVSCSENVSVSWYYYDWTIENFTLFATNSSTTSGVFSQVFTNFSGQREYWYVEMNGSVTGVSMFSDVYNFTMKSPIISNVSPESGAINVTYDTNGVNTSLNVSSYENVDITWYYYCFNMSGTENENVTSGEWIEYGNETNVSNGNYYKYFPYNYLSNTSFLYYFWMVELVGVETNTTTYDVYSFSIAIPTVYNPIPSDGATNVSFTSSGVNTSIEINTTQYLDLVFSWYNWTSESWEQYGRFSNVTGSWIRYGIYNANFSYGNMLCYWNVTVYLNGTADILSISIFNFTTLLSENVFNVVYSSPSDETVSVVTGGLNTTINVTHVTGSNIDITWYWFNYTGDSTNLSNWLVYAIDSNVPSNATYSHQNANFTVGNFTYYWLVYVRETDGYASKVFEYTFNTSSSINISSPSPASGETQVELPSAGILTSVDIAHVAGESVDIRWYYSKWKNEGGSWVANWTLYGTNFSVTNGTYSQYLTPYYVIDYHLEKASIGMEVYWYVVVQENASAISQNYIPSTYSDVYNFTLETLKVEMDTPVANSTIDLTENGVNTSITVIHDAGRKVDLYWYYFDWEKVGYETESISYSTYDNWTLYATDLGVDSNSSYYHWLDYPVIGNLYYYWLVRAETNGSSTLYAVDVSYFLLNSTIFVESVNPPEEEIGVVANTSGVYTSARVIQFTGENINITWQWYDYATEGWKTYATDSNVTSNVSRGHWNANFTHSYAKYYWLLNVSVVNSPTFSVFVFNFTTTTLLNFSGFYPAQNATDISITTGFVTTCFNVTQCAGNTITIHWYYYDYATEEWIRYGVNESVGNGTYSQQLPATRAGWTYPWRVAIWEE